MSCKKGAAFIPAAILEKGAGLAAHLHLKKHARKQPVSASTQNKHILNHIINDLWGILS